MNEVNPYESPDSVGSVGDDERYQPKLFSMSGRIGRLRHLAYATVYNISLFGVGLTAAMVLVTSQNPSDFFGGGIGIGVTLVYLIGFIAYICLARRRLNDLNHTGWFALLLIVPIVNVLFTLYIVFWPGTKGSNNYGQAPVKNSIGVIIAGTIVPVIVIVAIIAAVALPAYQDYVQSAAAMQSSE